MKMLLGHVTGGGLSFQLTLSPDNCRSKDRKMLNWYECFASQVSKLPYILKFFGEIYWNYLSLKWNYENKNEEDLGQFWGNICLIMYMYMYMYMYS